VTEAAAFAAWLGGAIIVLADGRRGLAVGLILLAAGLAVGALMAGEPVGAAALAAGGVVGSALRFRAGPQGWGLMKPGSTPRIILTVVIGLLALYFALSVSTGDGGALRFAALASIGLAGARLLQSADRAEALTAASALALALGAASVIAPGASLSACVAAAAVAAGASALPVAEPSGA
jgi:hypothetical protein